ncbi:MULTISPECIES: hypothetical protein [Aphanothece]|uniref:hypothetical protein n=1 Tax=Aphanothece TaxID=1121 RepID=UPI003984F11E
MAIGSFNWYFKAASTGSAARKKPESRGPGERAPSPEGWVTELSYVADGGEGCRIFRQTSGHYVVRHEQFPEVPRQAPTLACAYGLCKELELLASSDSATRTA